MKYEITTIGDCLRDIFIFSDAKLLSSGSFMGQKRKHLCFPYGEKIKINEFSYDLGGSSCNSAVALSRLGIKTSFATIVGDDLYSKDALETVEKEKINTSFIKKDKDKDLGFSIILTGPTGDRSILTHRPDFDFSKIDVDKIFKNSEAVYVSGINKYSKVLQKEIIRNVKKYQKPLFLNPSFYQIKENKTILRKMMKFTDVVCLNLVEATILAKRRKIKAKKLLMMIKNMGPKVVLITMGVRGSLYYDGENFYKIGIYENEKVDSTGSGDAYFATYIAAQMRGESVENSLKLAAVNAGATVDTYGAQKDLLKWRDLKWFLKKERVNLKSKEKK